MLSLDKALPSCSRPRYGETMVERLDIHVPGAAGQPDLRLENALGSGERGAAVVAHPHPLYGGDMSNPVVEAIAAGLELAGIAPLRFNFRGCGQSDGAPTADAALADADMRAAFAALRGHRPEPYIACGYSFGAATALRFAAKEPAIAALILVAPPVAMIDRAALKAYAGPLTLLLGDHDSYARLPELERALAGAPRVSLQILEGEDHFFSEGGEQLPSLVAAAAALVPAR